MSKDREAKSDVKLIEELSHVEELPKGCDFMEVNANLIMGESQGNDLCLVVNAWRVGGGRKGKWRVDDAMVGQTTFLMVPQSQRGRVQDDDFIGNRQDPLEWPGEIQIVQEPDRIIWQTGSRQCISRPPYWDVKGEHMGVSCDLTLGGLGKATRTFGPWQDLPTTRMAGYDHCCWAEGTITVGGREYTLKNGYGVHELMTFGETWDHMEVMRDKPYYWIVCLSESMQIYLLTMPGQGTSYGRIYMEGRELAFGRGEIAVDELKWWIDPKTVMQMPVRWHVNMNSADGVADMNMAAGGRCIYCIVTRTGYTLRYGSIARTNGSIFLPDGQRVSIGDMMTYVEWGRSALPLEGGAP